MAQPNKLIQALADKVGALKDYLQTSQAETTDMIKAISEETQRCSKSFSLHAHATRQNEKSQELLKKAQAALQDRDDKVARLEKEKYELEESLQAARSEAARLLQENTHVRRVGEMHKKNVQLEKEVEELSTYTKKLLTDKEAACQERDSCKEDNDKLSKALEAAQSELKEIRGRQAENEAYLARLTDVVQSRPLKPTASADEVFPSKRSDSQQTVGVPDESTRKPLASQSEAFSATLASGTSDTVLDDSAASLRGTGTATPSLSPHSKPSSAPFDRIEQTRQHGRSASRSSQDNVTLKSGSAGGAAPSDDQLPEARQTAVLYGHVTWPRTQSLHTPAPPKKPSNSEPRPSRPDSRTSISGAVDPEYISVRGAADAHQRQHGARQNRNETGRAYRVPRVLLCLECQRTGRQCDALEPCDNCVRAGMQCVRTRCPYFERYGDCTNSRCLRVHDEEGYTTQRGEMTKKRKR